MASPTPSRPTGSGTRQAILDSAVACFGANGYDATGVQEIVRRAGVTKGAFYHHFSSKEDLLRHIHHQFIDHCLAMTDRILGEGLPPRDALTALIEEMLAIVGSFQAEITIFFQERRFLSEETFADVRRKRDEVEARVTALLEEGQAAGQFRPLASTRLMALGLIGMWSWAYHWYRPGAMPPREVGRMYAEVIVDGLGSADGSSGAAPPALLPAGPDRSATPEEGVDGEVGIAVRRSPRRPGPAPRQAGPGRAGLDPTLR